MCIIMLPDNIVSHVYPFTKAGKLPIACAEVLKYGTVSHKI